MNGADVIAQAMHDTVVDTVFGLPGAHNLALWPACERADVRIVGMRHEQSCAYAADGFARVTGKVGAALVTTGPYRLSRNPGYLGMALGYAGIAILFGALWALVPLVPTLVLIDRGVIRREERHLERRFGEQYSRYRAQTRRWI